MHVLNSLVPTTPLLNKYAQGRPLPDLLLGTVRFLQVASAIDRNAVPHSIALEHVAGLLLAACTLQLLGSAAAAQHSSPASGEAAVQYDQQPSRAPATAATLQAAEQLQDTGALHHLASCINKARQVFQLYGVEQPTSSAPGYAAVEALAAVAGVMEAALAAEEASARQGVQWPSAHVPSLRLRVAVLQAAVAAADFAGRLRAEVGGSGASAGSTAHGTAGRCRAAAAEYRHDLKQHISRPPQEDLASGATRVAATACDMLSWMLSSEAPALNEEAVTWEVRAVQGLEQALKILTNAPQSLVAVAVNGWVGACAALTAAVKRDRPGGGSCRQALAGRKLEWAGMIAGVEGSLLQRPQCKQRRSQHAAVQQQDLKEKLTALSAVLCIEGLEQDSAASVQLSSGCVAPADKNYTIPDGVKGGPSAPSKVCTSLIYPVFG